MQEIQLKERASQVFFDAARYIENYGWQEKGMGMHGKPRCSMGALASANPEPLWNRTLSEFMYTALEKELHGVTLTEFNHRARNGKDVASLFKKVAASCMISGRRVS